MYFLYGSWFKNDNYVLFFFIRVKRGYLALNVNFAWVYPHSPPPPPEKSIYLRVFLFPWLVCFVEF